MKKQFRQPHCPCRRFVAWTPMAYLDNASTSLKPRAMIDRLQRFYSTEYAHPEEQHKRSKYVTELLEASRAEIAHLINAAEPAEIIFVRSTTEVINTLALSFGRGALQQGDEVLITDSGSWAKQRDAGCDWLESETLVGGVGYEGGVSVCREQVNARSFCRTIPTARVW